MFGFIRRGPSGMIQAASREAKRRGQPAGQNSYRMFICDGRMALSVCLADREDTIGLLPRAPFLFKKVREREPNLSLSK